MEEIFLKKCFSPQSKIHTAKLYFSVVLKFLGGIHRELLFYIEKIIISERSTEIQRNFFFLTCFKRVKSEENLDLFNQLFCSNQ